MLNLIVKAPVAERANLAHSQIGKRDFGSIKRKIALGKMPVCRKTPSGLKIRRRTSEF
jgi:hypothetical protein